MQSSIYNSRGQIVGFFDTEEKIYHTKRRATMGQIFLKKTMFDGQIKERAVAIDKRILGQLFARNCKKIIFTIIGIEKFAYSVWIKPEDVLKKGVKINFDKRNKEGQNATSFGEQYVVSSVTDCFRYNLNQMELKITKDRKLI